MQSESEELVVELGKQNAERHKLRSFELYEEYSQIDINKTIRKCREDFDKADVTTMRDREREVEQETEDFRAWLEETKNLEYNIAHYYSTSLKSLLLGLPAGVHVACLFDTILSTVARK